MGEVEEDTMMDTVAEDMVEVEDTEKTVVATVVAEAAMTADIEHLHSIKPRHWYIPRFVTCATKRSNGKVYLTATSCSTLTVEISILSPCGGQFFILQIKFSNQFGSQCVH